MTRNVSLLGVLLLGVACGSDADVNSASGGGTGGGVRASGGAPVASGGSGSGGAPSGGASSGGTSSGGASSGGASSGGTAPQIDPLAFALQNDTSSPNGFTGQEYGASVSIDADTLVVGAIGEDDDSGAAYVFVRTGNAWSFQTRLLAQTSEGILDGASNDAFGYSVAISGDTIVVGANGDDDQGEDSGSVYVYTRTPDTWAIQEKITARLPSGGADGAVDDRFGASVAISGDTIAVGAPDDDELTDSTGSVYVFRRTGDAWSTQTKLVATLPNGDADGNRGQKFGTSVDLESDTLVVGAPGDDEQGSQAGAGYVFTRSGTTWSTEWKLRARTMGAELDGTESDRFGWSVGVSGDSVVVGAIETDEVLSDSGSVYVYTRAGTTWSIEQKFGARLPNGVDDAAEGERFGHSVAIDDDLVVVGAPGDDEQGGSAGAIHIYQRQGGSWTPLAKRLPPSFSSANAFFGSVVDLSGTTSVVGAHFWSVRGYAGVFGPG